MNATRRAPAPVFGRILLPTSLEQNEANVRGGFRSNTRAAIRAMNMTAGSKERAHAYVMRLYNLHRDMGGAPDAPVLLPARERQKAWAPRGYGLNPDDRARRRMEARLEAQGILGREGRRGLYLYPDRRWGPDISGPERRYFSGQNGQEPDLSGLIRHFPKNERDREYFAEPPTDPPGDPGDPGGPTDAQLLGEPEKAAGGGLGVPEKNFCDQATDRELCGAPGWPEAGTWGTELAMPKSTPPPPRGKVPDFLLEADARIRAQLAQERAERVAAGGPEEVNYRASCASLEAHTNGHGRSRALAPEPAREKGPPPPNAPPPKPRRCCRLPDDRAPADVGWIQFDLRRVPCLQRVSIPTLFKKKHTRGVWRAAVAAALAEAPGRLRESPEAFILGVAKRLAEGKATDVRLGAHFFPLSTWPAAMAEFANVPLPTKEPP